MPTPQNSSPAAFAPAAVAATLDVAEDKLLDFPHIVADPLTVERDNPQRT